MRTPFEITKEKQRASNAVPLVVLSVTILLDWASCTSSRTNAALSRTMPKRWDTAVVEDLIVDDDASAKVRLGSIRPERRNPSATS
jgi:hypothetical protein